MSVYELLFRYLLRLVGPEHAHQWALELLRVAQNQNQIDRFMQRRLLPDSTEGMQIKALGMEFSHPIGLAAGFDKDAYCPLAFRSLGFSFVEVGTVTPRPQPGNSGKRLFRLFQDDALVNRLGFPSIGAAAVTENLKNIKDKGRFPIGISIGKNQDTVLDSALFDYLNALKITYPYADYFVLNISSPNTVELRSLQASSRLKDLLLSINTFRHESTNSGQRKPLLIKISPDLSIENLDAIIEVVLEFEVDGIIATNTTLNFQNLSRSYTYEGGLSGKPLRDQSTRLIRHVYRQIGDRVPIIGVGGVFTGQHVWEKMVAGASLIQIYTGFVYRGLYTVKECTRQLKFLMNERGIQNLTDIIGSET